MECEVETEVNKIEVERNVRRCAALLVVTAGLALGACAGEWAFENAKLSPDKATGREADGRLEMSLPSKRACAWWESEFPVTPGKGARFTATAEIALGAGEASPYNDVMLFVTWYDPARGNRKGVRFYQRDFMRYTDGRAACPQAAVRTFDDTFAVPSDCNTVRVEFIAKWHKMDVKIRDVRVETIEAPKPRKVRCVVGNPHERRPKSWDDPEAVVKGRLKQIEDCLTNIFAHVEHPDIILFSEVFADTGTPCPERTAERIPGGPSFALAARYAVKYRCNIAMNVRERTDAGTFHNSTFVVDRAGRHVGTYRKTTLTSGEYMAGLLPGDDFGVFDLDFGRVGCLTCWDHWFSETAKYLRRKGAELLLFPLAGCAPDHVDITFPARGIDIGIPTLVSMRQGHLPNGIIDRDGTWLVKTFEDGGFAWADLDLNERKRTFWLSVGPGAGDPYELYIDESRPELYEKQDLRRPRR